MIKLSRSKLELLFECPRCFWLYAGKGISRPFGPPFTINSAIDFMLKKEFDEHRNNGTAHHLIEEAGIDAIPYLHEDIDKWRNTFTGIQYHHKPTDFLIFGAVDDIWVDSKGNLIVVDYKASGAKEGELYDNYKRQMEIYQWILRQMGFEVLDRGYFVYCRVNKDNGFAHGNLNFNIKIQPYDGDSSWVEEKIIEAKKILDGRIPKASMDCDFCKYRNTVNEAENFDDKDELFEDAVEFARGKDTITASLIQQNFNTGYARAARILDELESARIVGPGEGSMPRRVLQSDEK